ncbi:MAG: methionyl aminopeptidase [Candidatus Arcticimaribacter sp.]|jgi:methionyl aminopeptidase|tara:strand:+ start:1442 stop:2200 length:759 start_codon:yes stop_codon:yes gene_type:complete
MVHKRSNKEIEMISRSCQIVADTIEMITDFVVPGALISDLDKKAEKFIISRGARPAFKGYMGFPATLCVSIEDAVVHGIPHEIELEEGQIVGIDCGAELNGYYGDHAKTFAVGDISDEKKNLMIVTEESLHKGIEMAIPGNCVGDIGHAVQTHAESNGYSVVRELVGHGIGENLHEEPQVPNYGRPSEGYKLHAGMCIAIEPMINLGKKEVYTAEDGWTIFTVDGKASAHFEHTIAIMEDGPKILSKVGKNG